MVYAVYSNGLDPAKVAAEKARKKRAQELKKKKQNPTPPPCVSPFCPPGGR
jgi:hypothetical protein